MRIQYSSLDYSPGQHFFASGAPIAPVMKWSEWKDWPIGRGLMPTGMAARTRIMDDDGEEVAQTPAFVPAYYERKRPSGTTPGPLHWCTADPAGGVDFWIRRDDVKPAARD